MVLPHKLTNLLQEFQPFLQPWTSKKLWADSCYHTKFTTRSCLIFLDFWDVLLPKASGHFPTCVGLVTGSTFICWRCRAQAQILRQCPQPMSTGLEQAARYPAPDRGSAQSRSSCVQGPVFLNTNYRHQSNQSLLQTWLNTLLGWHRNGESSSSTK